MDLRDLVHRRRPARVRRARRRRAALRRCGKVFVVRAIAHGDCCCGRTVGSLGAIAVIELMRCLRSLRSGRVVVSPQSRRKHGAITAQSRRNGVITAYPLVRGLVRVMHRFNQPGKP